MQIRKNCNADKVAKILMKYAAQKHYDERKDYLSQVEYYKQSFFERKLALKTIEVL